MADVPKPASRELRPGLLSRGSIGRRPCPSRLSGIGSAFSVHDRGVTVSARVSVRVLPPAETFTLIVPDWTIVPAQLFTLLFPALANVERPVVNLQLENVAPAGAFFTTYSPRVPR